MGYTLLIVGTKKGTELLEGIRNRCNRYVEYKVGIYNDMKQEMELQVAMEHEIPIIAYGALDTAEERTQFINRIRTRHFECAFSMSECNESTTIEMPDMSEGYFLIADLDRAINLKKYNSPTIVTAGSTQKNKSPKDYERFESDDIKTTGADNGESKTTGASTPPQATSGPGAVNVTSIRLPTFPLLRSTPKKENGQRSEQG